METNRNDTIARETTRGQAGFTIMEVLIVLAIIALIMGVLVGPKLFKAGEEAKRRNAHTMAVQFASAYARWSLDHQDACPSNISELVKYMTNKSDTKDPWGREFIMLCGESAPPETEGFGIVSVGKDGKQGTDDDIKSWESPVK
ncbi:MAG: prepilin-type N-terminal cleavage/methylation domain-containing protein [Deltaproteobacteria bacterium]|nr:MAG: prepilin-type N-terminal cleavage/methylation domain-containing protein [Deltaproteobacteria bacterium]